LRYIHITGIFLLLLIACSMQVVNSQPAQDVNVIVPLEPVCSRTVYLEPSYQVYIDEVSLLPPTASFNISFRLLDATDVYAVYAYGPQNETLRTRAYWDSTSKIYTVNINTTGINSFKLLTIYHEMSINIDTFSTYVNFFPIVDNSSSASTSVYLPSGAQLLNYDESYLSNSTSGERILISGSKQLIPGNASFGVVGYSGNYSLVEADSFSRTIKVTPSTILMEETIKVRNSGLYTSSSKIILNAPEGATDLKAMDTIGYLNLVQSGQTITVDLRSKIYPDEYYEFTLLYSLPPSTLIKIVDGRDLMSGNVLPDWFNMPAKQVSLTVLMPPGSSDAQMVGGNITEKGGSLAASTSHVFLTPYTNEAFRLTFTPSPYASYMGTALIIVIVVVVIVIAFLYRKFKKGAKEIVPSPAVPSPAKPAPPPPPEKKKKIPPKGKRRRFLGSSNLLNLNRILKW